MKENILYGKFFNWINLTFKSAIPHGYSIVMFDEPISINKIKIL